MDSQLIIYCCLIVILLTIIQTSYKKEGFVSIFTQPGVWVGNQARGLWNGVQEPAKFARDVFYNMTPNYTMVDRYLRQKNDWVRANKGLPLTKPSRARVNVRLNSLTNTKNNNYGAKLGSTSTKSIGDSFLKMFV